MTRTMIIKQHLLALLTFMLASAEVSAANIDVQPSFNEWHDLQVNDINRYPVHADFPVSDSLSLSGSWKFNWVPNADERPTDFYKLEYKDSLWKTMPVPGIWELNGYGEPDYVNMGFAWRGHFNQCPLKKKK